VSVLKERLLPRIVIHELGAIPPWKLAAFTNPELGKMVGQTRGRIRRKTVPSPPVPPDNVMP
jgi:hypothetical protein